MGICEEIRESFSPFLDGELPPDEGAAVEAHLAECPACLRELSRYQRVTALYRALPAVSAPEGFAAGVARAIRPQVVVLAKRRQLRRAVWPLVAAAAVFLVIAIPVYRAQQMVPAPSGFQISKQEAMPETIEKDHALPAMKAAPEPAVPDMPESMLAPNAIPPPVKKTVPLSEEVKQQVNALGYLDADTPVGGVELDKSGREGAGGAVGSEAMPAPPAEMSEDASAAAEALAPPALGARSMAMPEHARRQARMGQAAAAPETRVAADRKFVLVNKVWQQEDYAGETVVALIMDSDRFKTLRDLHPEVAQFAELGPRVIFYLNDLWYALQPAESTRP